MLKYAIERLETLSDGDFREISDLTAKAFAGDVLWRILIGGDWALHAEYCKAALRATILEGELYVLTIGKGKKREIASWATWFPPGRNLFSSEAQRALGYNDVFKKFKPQVKDWLINMAPKYLGPLLNELFTEKERGLIWWCEDLATRPDLEGNGFATALMDIGYQKAKKTKGLGTFIGLITQTEENVVKYTSMGFKKIGEVVDIPVPVPVPGETTMAMYIMVRKP